MIEIGPHSFSTQKAAKAHFQALFARYRPGDRVLGADHDDLMDLTSLHPCAAEKIGPGIDGFRIVLAPYGRALAYEILRIDGSSTDISYLKCISGEAPRRTLVLQSLRRAIEQDMNILRQRLFRDHLGSDGRMACEATGERILPTQGHLDHIAPRTFNLLATLFLEGKGIRFEDVTLCNSEDGEVGRRISDVNLVWEFREYHARTARFRFVSAHENLSAGGRHSDAGHRIRCG